jgi:hypothetical protein
MRFYVGLDLGQRQDHSAIARPVVFLLAIWMGGDKA